MNEKVPIAKATTGLGGHFEVPSSCKAQFQMMLVDIENGKAINSLNLKNFVIKKS
jgi:hypothetical protein